MRADARPGDVLVLLGPAHEPELRALARRGAPWGLVTIWFVTDLGVDPLAPTVEADHVVRVATTADDGTVGLVLAYHLLWELTHVVFEHPGLLGADVADEPEACVTCSDEARIAEVQSVADDDRVGALRRLHGAGRDRPRRRSRARQPGPGARRRRHRPHRGAVVSGTDFLYPFIEGDERDADALLADLATSARGKVRESARLRAETLERCATELAATAVAMAHAFRRGGRLFTFGNGGSATDARLVAERFRSTDSPARPLPALCLCDAPAVITALANDVGFDLVFARSLDAIGRAGDVALGCSTSGGSRNVLHALETAHAKGMVTVGVAGYDGGAMATSADLDHCLVVRSQSVHRIQEAQAALFGRLWARVHDELEREDAP